MPRLLRSLPLALVATAGVALASPDPIKPGDTITTTGTITRDFTLNTNSHKRGAVQLTNTKDGEIGQALQFLLGERIEVEGEYKGTQAHVVDGALRTVETKIRVTKILSPAYRPGVEGVVLFRGGIARVHLYENGALQGTSYGVKNVPQQVLINLRNVRLRFSAFTFDNEINPELKLISVRTRVRLPGFLSDDELAKISGNADVKPGDDLSLRIASLRIKTAGKDELEEFIDWARPNEFRPVDRTKGEFLFAQVKTRDSRRGYYPLWKLWLGRSTKSGTAGPGLTGALGDANGGFTADDVQDRIDSYLQAVHEEHIDSAYEWAFEDAKDDPALLASYQKAYESERKEYESHVNADGDLEPFDGWIDDSDWLEDYGVDSKNVQVYALSWYTEAEGIGLSQYFAFNTKTGELITESDIWD